MSSSALFVLSHVCVFAGELIWSNLALSRALLGLWSKVGSLGRVYVIIVDTFEEKKESGHHRKYGFYSPLSTVNFNSSKICQFSFILRNLLNKILILFRKQQLTVPLTSSQNVHLLHLLYYVRIFVSQSNVFPFKHRKNCECCPGHHLIVDHYSSI